MKRALAACALIVALAVAFMSPASAAQLVLTGGQHPYAFTTARCDDALAATTPTTTTTTKIVQLSGIAAACAGLHIAVQVYDSTNSTSVTGTATAPATGGVREVTLSLPYTPTATTVLSVTIASWPIPATWTYVAPPTGVGCVVLDPVTLTWAPTCSLTYGTNLDGTGPTWHVNVTVSTTEKNFITWRATVDFADLARFPFVAKYVGEVSGTASYAPLPAGFCSGSTRLVTFIGIVQRNTDQVKAGSSRTFEFLGSNTGQTTNPVYSCP